MAWMYDAAFGYNIPRAAPIVGGYLKSPSAYHQWSDSEWAMNRAALWLPIFVADWKGDPIAQADQAVLETVALGLKDSRPICLDVEAQWVGQAWTRPYVERFIPRIASHGFIPVGYTSESTLKVFDGLDCELWVAGGQVTLGGNLVAHQTLFAGPYDRSEVVDGFPVALPIKPTPPIQTDPVQEAINMWPNIQQNSPDWHRVEKVQGLLNSFGYRLVEDGGFGGLTLRAVTDFQTKQSLTVDGVVGSKTLARLIVG